ncbi:protein GVQW3-like [Nylanderia fulva]|uniref:protein GVQW3-like n=1 Tax=Nylanderia fulva TaxID=613905 RepID=UPI0010FAEC4B|nr:protein GVQW3-like [Nylanderia fulva]
MEQRANIKFCFKLGKTFSETYELMQKVYGDDCLARSKVHKWFKRFKNGREDLNDDERPGRPEGSNRAELVEKVREIIAVDGNFTVRMLAEELNSSTGTIWTILTDDLGKRKVCARFVPHQLNKDQKIARVEHCKDIISTAKNDLSPCDYFLFPKLKTAMKGAFYDDIPAIQAAVTQVLKNIPLDDMKESMHKLVDRSKRCIELNGDYFE